MPLSKSLAACSKTSSPVFLTCANCPLTKAEGVIEFKKFFNLLGSPRLTNKSTNCLPSAAKPCLI